MDILKPAIIRIGGRCYRKNPIQKKTVEEYEDEEIHEAPMDVDEESLEEVYDAFYNNIEQTENGFRATLDVANAYFKYIIGKKGETKKKLEYETRTQIRIPKQGEEGNIVILGRDRKGMLSAKTRIDLLVQSARHRQPFTHFLSFPVNSEPIQESFLDFKEDVLRFCDGDRGLDASIFQNPKKLHLTVGTMALLSEAEVSQAVELLSQCSAELIQPIIGSAPLQARLRGLQYMNDDPHEVDVVYAKVELQDDSDRLQVLADRLVDKFAAAGLMRKEYDQVKLHATVINTLMRKDPNGAGVAASLGGNIRERESFDASQVLRSYRDFDFGHHHISNIHLSQRYSTGCAGYYACEASIPLP